MPATVGAALAGAHRPHDAEADSFIGADRSEVGTRWIDRHAMMASLLEEPSRHKLERSAAPPQTLILGRKEDVQARLAVVGVGLLVVSKPPRQGAVDFDRERRAVVAQTSSRVLEVFLWAPPLAHPGARQYRHE